MKPCNACYHGLLKTVAFFLSVISLVVAIVSGLGIIALVDMDGYNQSKDDMLREKLSYLVYSVADDIANIHAQELYGSGLGYRWSEYYYDYEDTNYRYTLTNGRGRTLSSTYDGQDVLYTFTTDVPVSYRKLQLMESTDRGEYYHEEEIYLEEPWTVTGYILRDMRRSDQFSLTYHVSGMLHDLRYWFIALLAFGLLTCLCCTIYLLFGAGHRRGKEELTLNLFDRIYGDIYLAAVIVLVVLAVHIFDMTTSFGYRSSYSVLDVTLAVLAFLATVAGLWTVVLAFALTVATRLKQSGGYIWRHTLTFRLLRLMWKLVKLCWRGVKWMGRGLVQLFRLLPLVWQWLLLGLVLLFVFFLAAVAQEESILLVGCIMWLLLTVHLALSMGILQKHIRIMAQGNLDRKIPTRGLFGNFLLMAQDVNALSAGAEAEVERRMRSERMKTELITNVSHDIKTPLTSLVTYVDLLQKPHTEPEGQEYLAVLARQSQRLKKLTEDLVEMSKASSGNLPVTLGKTNVVELIEQALAEYEAKMEGASLQVVKRLPEVELNATADGRLFWRVMDNLLSNCVKYAMTGTRVYVDAAATTAGIAVSLRNISAEVLNLTPEELQERFVRGDRSRNTEGSGLGLNIAKSLMELQQGSLRVEVDGDLFKVVLTLKPWVDLLDS